MCRATRKETSLRVRVPSAVFGRSKDCEHMQTLLRVVLRARLSRLRLRSAVADLSTTFFVSVILCPGKVGRRQRGLPAATCSSSFSACVSTPLARVGFYVAGVPYTELTFPLVFATRHPTFSFPCRFHRQSRSSFNPNSRNARALSSRQRCTRATPGRGWWR